MEDVILKIISQVGVPAGIAMYVLIEVNKTMKELRKVLDRNTMVLIAMLDKFDCDEKVKDILLDTDDVKDTKREG